MVEKHVIDLVASLITEDVDIFNEVFGWGRKQQQTQPQPQTQPKNFKFDDRATQSAEAFADTIISQIPQVLGSNYAGVLRRTRSGEYTLKKQLMSYWGQAGNTVSRNFQNTGGLNNPNLPATVAKLIDNIAWKR